MKHLSLWDSEANELPESLLAVLTQSGTLKRGASKDTNDRRSALCLTIPMPAQPSEPKCATRKDEINWFCRNPKEHAYFADARQTFSSFPKGKLGLTKVLLPETHDRFGWVCNERMHLPSAASTATKWSTKLQTKSAKKSPYGVLKLPPT